MSRLGEIRRILWWILILNLIVAAAKWGYGVMTYSLGLQADGLHSTFDGLSNVIGLIGLWLATATPDAHHPYGHKKFETLAAGSIGGFLVMTCLYLLWKAYQSWTLDLHPQVTGISFFIMIGTMGINIFVSQWERRKGIELRSDILTADSYHTASDVLTSCSVLAGLLAVKAGYAFVDPLVAVLIAGVTAWTASIVLKDVLSSLTDTVRLNPEEVHTAVMSISGVLHCHDIRTRGLNHHVFMDLSVHLIRPYQSKKPIPSPTGLKSISLIILNRWRTWSSTSNRKDMNASDGNPEGGC
ncbi:cation diffusion facilitator family transporter [Candidatus Nitrospira neomarina]|uniref:Cation diffusion facilitator family transporter n=1 Tax=Candidatus Nitrospira neomarina TaxID=3020899 RepID=A0AA96K328_9BACT|nr:cation diffusion facilitator family transporter [Candidatus Nitrospira neomarina]WNM62159.1 cation diffusion facilitator family transporter [Candidatus Nitrospira neomarina]